MGDGYPETKTSKKGGGRRQGSVTQEVLDRWNADQGALSESIGLMLTNQLAEGDAVLDARTEAVAKRTIDFKGGEHDLRGCFALVGALMKLVHGLASLGDKQLDTVLTRVWAADELLLLDEDWAGKTVLRGLCLLVAGTVEVMQRELTKGVWHILRSWIFLRHLETEGLQFDGHERSCVRSTALYALGIFKLFCSMLPRQAMRTAGWLTGFKGGRDVAVDHLRTCWKEGGIQAPFAALVLVGFSVDVSSFLGELWAERSQRHREARQVLDWAREKHPGSFFFEGLEAAYFAAERDVPAALRQLEGIQAQVKDLPAFDFLVHVRKATLQTALCSWSAAGASFMDAVEIHRKVGRRALCPTLALNSYLCCARAGETGEGSRGLAALELCRSYRKEKKKWAITDRESLALAELAWKAAQAAGGESPKVPCFRPALVLYMKMCINYRSVCSMSTEQADAFIKMVQEETKSCVDSDDADGECMGCCVEAEAARQCENWDLALRAASRGIALQPRLSAAGRKSGALHFCHLVMAYAHYASGSIGAAKDALSKLGALTGDNAYAKQVEFKATHLRGLVGAEIQDAYTEVSVPARGSARLTARIPADVEEVKWEWILADMTLNFDASFRAKGGRSPEEEEGGVSEKETALLQQLEQHDASRGPVEGRLETQGRAGRLELIFDNSFSLLRGKTVHVRLEPSTIQLRKKDA